MENNEPSYNMAQTIMQDHINQLVKKEEDLIMRILKKQKGFVSIEKSKHLIEVNRMYRNEAHVGTDYLFNGNRFLTIYPVEFSESDGRFNATTTYLEY